MTRTAAATFLHALALFTAAPVLAEPDPGNAWVFEVESASPRGEFAPEFRDIQAVSLTAMRSWRQSNGFEFQLGGGLYGATGVRSEPFSSEPPEDSDAAGVKAGGRVRYNFPPVGPVRPFVDGYAGVVWTPGSPFPAGGTAVNGQAAWGGGVAFEMTESWSFEAGYRRQHLSNGGGLVDYNPAFDSHGAFIGVRRSLDHNR